VPRGVPRARAALPRGLLPQYSASAGGGHDRVRDGAGWNTAAFAHARHPPCHRDSNEQRATRNEHFHSSALLIVPHPVRSCSRVCVSGDTVRRATWATPTPSLAPCHQGRGAKPPTSMRTAPLQRLPAVHARPLHPVVCRGTSSLSGDVKGHLPVGFPLRCAQRFSHPDVATRRCCFGNNRHTSGRSSPVLSY
jgi:hypothetical protein